MVENARKALLWQYGRSSNGGVRSRGCIVLSCPPPIKYKYLRNHSCLRRSLSSRQSQEQCKRSSLRDHVMLFGWDFSCDVSHVCFSWKSIKVRLKAVAPPLVRASERNFVPTCLRYAVIWNETSVFTCNHRCHIKRNVAIRKVIMFKAVSLCLSKM